MNIIFLDSNNNAVLSKNTRVHEIFFNKYNTLFIKYADNDGSYFRIIKLEEGEAVIFCGTP